MKSLNVSQVFTRAVEVQSNAVNRLLMRVPDNLEFLTDRLLSSRGKLIITGMGKSGIIGRKIAATLASTGTSSFFVHPAEAYHGDLGMISPSDSVLAISNSGETEEVLRLISFLKQNGNFLVAMTGAPESTLARNADFHFDVSVEQEACPFQLAPTSSTTATLVIGDALAITLMEERGFQPEDFARYHPGGTLGRRLLTTVDMVMRKEDFPVVREADCLPQVVHVISAGRCGLAVVQDEMGLVRGIITDGDLRRAMDQGESTFFSKIAAEIMTKNPHFVDSGTLLSEAEEKMALYKVNSLLVVVDNRLKGIVQIFDL